MRKKWAAIGFGLMLAASLGCLAAAMQEAKPGALCGAGQGKQ